LWCARHHLAMIEPPRRDDAGHAVGGQRHVAQQHAGVDGEVVDALFGLFDQRVAEDFPGQVFGLAVDLFQRLIDRHGADGDRAVADDPFAGFVDVLAGGQVHHGVAAPADRPGHFLDFFLNAGPSAELPMLALILTRKLRPMIIGSLSGWLMLLGMMARPRAISLRTNSGVISSGNAGAEVLAGVLAAEQGGHFFAHFAG
jgi:hypothetical protein